MYTNTNIRYVVIRHGTQAFIYGNKSYMITGSKIMLSHRLPVISHVLSGSLGVMLFFTECMWGDIDVMIVCDGVQSSRIKFYRDERKLFIVLEKTWSMGMKIRRSYFNSCLYNLWMHWWAIYLISRCANQTACWVNKHATPFVGRYIYSTGYCSLGPHR